MDRLRVEHGARLRQQPATPLTQPADSDRAAGRPIPAREHAHSRRLSRPVWTQKRVTLPRNASHNTWFTATVYPKAQYAAPPTRPAGAATTRRGMERRRRVGLARICAQHHAASLGIASKRAIIRG